MRTVTLTDTSGAALGEADLVEAHTGQGALHRAFSVYVFRNDQEKGKREDTEAGILPAQTEEYSPSADILIQQRSAKKMLWPLIWANTCCSHPFPNESPADAGSRRLKEELGFDCALTPHSRFVYRAEDPQKRGVEHEYVTILIGHSDQPTIKANPDEVAAYQWIKIVDLQEDMAKNPDRYAPWFHLGLAKIFPARS